MPTFTINFDAEQKKIGECVSDVLNVRNVRKATAYISERRVIKATAQCRANKRSKSVTILVTVGKPNFVERRFIRLCKKAGMVFPLRQIQWRFWTEKKGGKK